METDIMSHDDLANFCLAPKSKCLSAGVQVELSSSHLRALVFG